MVLSCTFEWGMLVENKVLGQSMYQFSRARFNTYKKMTKEPILKRCHLKQAMVFLCTFE